MEECHSLLTCVDIKESVRETNDVIGTGNHKIITTAIWRGHRVAYMQVDKRTVTKYGREFNPSTKQNHMEKSLNLLIDLSPSPYVSQVVGYCNTPQIRSFITQLYPLGDSGELDKVLSSEAYKHLDSVATRFRICVSYVMVIDFLHTQSRLGPLVLMDDGDLHKRLTQFLITNDFSLVANDLGRLVQVPTGSRASCRKRITGKTKEFVAPEIRMESDHKSANIECKFDEKIDIWKIPFVCEAFLGKTPEALMLIKNLSVIHAKCKDTFPQNRPTAAHILKEYMHFATQGLTQPSFIGTFNQ